jgi:hypothetical protein
VLNFKKLFGHFSCDINLIKTFRPMLWARPHEVCDYDLKIGKKVIVSYAGHHSQVIICHSQSIG